MSKTVANGFARTQRFAELICISYADAVGKPLLPGHPTDRVIDDRLYTQASFCLLAHDTSADPRFIYANRTAQQCFEYTWDEITRLPSRLSATPQDRPERQQFIDTVRRDGVATGYRGLRVAKSGRLFWIEDVTMWQVKQNGVLLAEAAVYRSWRDA